MKFEDIKNSESFNYLTQEQKEIAFKNGRVARERRIVTKIGEKLGRKVVIENTRSTQGFKSDGYIDSDGVIHIDLMNTKPITFIFKHELTHFIESNPKEYNDLANAIMDSKVFNDWVIEKGYYSVEDYRSRLMKAYGKKIKGFDEMAANEEALANFVGENLFGDDTEVTEKLISSLEEKQRRSFVDMIKAFIEKLKSVFARKRSARTEIERFENHFIKAYKAAQAKFEQKNNTAKNGGEKFIIATDENGRYVKVDIDQDIFNGKTTSEMQAIARRVISKRFKGSVLPVGEKGRAYVNKHSADEYAFPANRRMNDDIKQSKMQASTELDHLLKVSEFIGHHEDDGRHPLATGGWDVYSTRFEIGGNMFSGEVQIMVANRGYLFYDITKIKRLPVNGGQTENKSAAASGNLSTDSIDQNNSSVNTQFMQKSQKNSIPLKDNADLLDMYERGEISRAEYLERISENSRRR